MTGKVLNNRYELIEKTGSGGMADVYKARCRVLKRWVAVKILKDEFVNDEEFLERFEREAYAAGSLNHPNIVSIYDVGREGNTHYIVMEYVDGITLKDYIVQNGAIPWQEAADIAISILSALHKAHRHNIIHRDIKPQNILMTSDQVPKVADFGIARAASTATATQKVDTVGSVHYASPEQARGGYTDEKSDLYSVGVTLFEMVTGNVPFNADNPVTVALKQIEAEPPVPSELVSEIPAALDNIILRAMKKHKSERYDNALQMIAELDHLKKGEAGAEEPNGQTRIDPFATRIMESVEEETLPKKNRNKKVRNKKREKQPEKNQDKESQKKGKGKKSSMVLVYMLLFVLIFGGLYLVYDNVVKPILDTIFEPTVPDVVLESYAGKTLEEAIADLERLNLPYEEPVYEYHDTVEAGIVISQKPPPGMSMKQGDAALNKVELVVSSGVQKVIIPEDIKFKDALDVIIQLRDQLKLNPREETEYNDAVAQGLVIRTEPEIGSEVKVGDRVTVYKSLGPKLKDVFVPDLTGLTLEEARHRILSHNLVIGSIFPEDKEGYKGRIYNQEPKAGDTVKELTPINLYFQEQESTGGGSGSFPGDTFISKDIYLPEGVVFGDTIKLRAYAVLSNEEEQTVREGEFKKSNFPLTVLVRVTQEGKTTLKVYMDDKFQYQLEVYATQ